MRVETCEDCGAEISGADREALLASAKAHFDEVHPRWQLGPNSIENWVDAKQRVSPAAERLEAIGDVEVHEVTGRRIDDMLSFFETDAFAGNAGWASCYCMFYHREDPMTNGSNPWRENRDAMRKRLESGSTIGYLAYVDGQPAGWCNASLRSAYPVRATGDQDDQVGVVACFVIAPAYRRHGLSKKLLDAAIAGFARRGVSKVEAHPMLGTDADPANYHGPLPLFIAAGFEIAEQDERSARVVKVLT